MVEYRVWIVNVSSSSLISSITKRRESDKYKKKIIKIWVEENS